MARLFSFAIPRSGLKWWLIATIGILAFAVTLALSQVVSRNAQRQIEGDKANLLSRLAQGMADRLDQDMRTRAQQILFLSRSSLMATRETPLEEKRALLEQVKAAYPNYAWIGMTDDAGNMLVGTDGLLVGKNLDKQEWFIEGSKGLHFGNAHDAFPLSKQMPKPKRNRLPPRLVDVSAPVHDDKGRLVGVICGHLSLDGTFEVLERMRATQAGKSTELILLDADGRVLMGPPSLPLASANLSHLHAVRKARSSGASVLVEPWTDGTRYLTAAVLDTGFRGYPGMGWTLVARQPEQNAFAPARRLGMQVLALGILLALPFGIFLGWILIRRLHTLERVSAAPVRTRKDLTPEIPPVRGQNEITSFARSFTDLVEDLQTANDELWLTSRIFEETNQMGLFDDISEKMEYERKLLHLANYDALTDLPNRHLLQRKIGEAIERTSRDGSRTAVLFADLDEFKKINDTLGHPTGDRILTEVARRFSGIAGAGETIARWGGDEFVAVISIAREDTAATQAKNMLECLRAPFLLDSVPYKVGASIGIALYPDDGQDAAGLIRCADAAMYEAKRSGKNRFAFFDATANARTNRLPKVENTPHDATDNNETRLRFQPRPDIDGTEIPGAAMLMHWHHRELLEVGPETLIQVAEQGGHELTEGVIEQSLLGVEATELSVGKAASAKTEHTPIDRPSFTLEAMESGCSDLRYRRRSRHS